MKTLLIYLFSLLCSLPSWSQKDQELIRSLLNKIGNEGTHEGIPYYALNSNNTFEVEGSGYLDEEWQEGLVLTPEGDVFRIKGRYNAYADEMQVLINKQMKALFPRKIRGVSLGEKVFIPTSFYDKFDTKSFGFFEVLSEGEIALLIRYEAVTRGVNDHPLLGSTNNKVEINIQESFFVRVNGEAARPLKKKKKEVLKVLAKKEEKIVQLAKEEKLSFGKQEDLRKIFDYYNGIKG